MWFTIIGTIVIYVLFLWALSHTEPKGKGW
jgi:hypothetical protein